MDDALTRLMPELYAQLRRQAERHTSRQAGSMQPSSVVNEVWIKLAVSESAQFRSKAHFAAVAARAMRQVLADRARKRMALKRGGDLERVGIESLGSPAQTVSVVAIEQAMQRLEAQRARAAEVVELRLFGGLTLDEIADVLDVSVGTVKREWRVARAFLIDALS